MKILEFRLYDLLKNKDNEDFLNKVKKENPDKYSMFIELNLKYYPIILDAIKTSKKVSDLINGFKIIMPKLTEDAMYLYKKNKYNI